MGYLVGHPPPPGAASEDAAYRFPFMACEVLCCGVPQLLDAVVALPSAAALRRHRAGSRVAGGASGGPTPATAAAPACHLDTLFAPALRAAAAAAVGGGGGGHDTPSVVVAACPPAHAAPAAAATAAPAAPSLAPPLPAFLLGYWCKVVALLAKRRPAALVRYLDASPGVAAGLAGCSTHLSTGSVAALVSTLLDLPWGGGQLGDAAPPSPASSSAGSSMGMATCHLARGDRLPLAATHAVISTGSPPPPNVATSAPREAAARRRGAAWPPLPPQSGALTRSLFGPPPASPTAASAAALGCAPFVGSVPWLLLRTLAVALDTPTHATVAAAAHAAEVLLAVFTQARCGSPHAKYAREGYNLRQGHSTRLRSGSGGAAHSREDGGDHATSGGAGAGGDHQDAGALVADPVLRVRNTQLDASYYDASYCCDSSSAAQLGRDRAPVRVLKLLRDGPLGCLLLLPLAHAAVSSLAVCRAGLSAAAAEAPLRVLGALFDSAALAALHVHRFGYGASRRGSELEPAAPALGNVGACPRLLIALCQQAPPLVASSSTNTATMPAPPPDASGGAPSSGSYLSLWCDVLAGLVATSSSSSSSSTARVSSASAGVRSLAVRGGGGGSSVESAPPGVGQQLAPTPPVVGAAPTAPTSPSSPAAATAVSNASAGTAATAADAAAFDSAVGQASAGGAGAVALPPPASLPGGAVAAAAAMAPAPSMPGAPALGTGGLALVRALAALLKAAAASQPPPAHAVAAAAAPATSPPGERTLLPPAHVRAGWTDVVLPGVVSSGLLPLLWDCLAAWPWHSILHRAVCDALRAVISVPAPSACGPAAAAAPSAAVSTAVASLGGGGDAGGSGGGISSGMGAHPSSPSSSQLLRTLLFDGRLLSRLAAGCKLAGMPVPPSPTAAAAAATGGSGVGGDGSEPHARRAGAGGAGGARSEAGPATASLTVGAAAARRVGYAGHIASLSNALLAAYAARQLPAACAALLASHSDWWTAVDGELACYNVAHGLLLGGALPPDTKASGNVGNAADATGSGGGKAAAVDEVAALDNKAKPAGDEEDGGSVGSDDDEDEGGRGGARRGDRDYDDDDDDDDRAVRRGSGAHGGVGGGGWEISSGGGGGGGGVLDDEADDEDDAVPEEVMGQPEEPEEPPAAYSQQRLEDDDDTDEDGGAFAADFAALRFDAAAPSSSADGGTVDFDAFGAAAVPPPTGAADSAPPFDDAFGSGDDAFSFNAQPAPTAPPSVAPGPASDESAWAGDFGDSFSFPAPAPAAAAKLALHEPRSAAADGGDGDEWGAWPS